MIRDSLRAKFDQMPSMLDSLLFRRDRVAFTAYDILRSIRDLTYRVADGQATARQIIDECENLWRLGWEIFEQPTFLGGYPSELTRVCMPVPKKRRRKR